MYGSLLTFVTTVLFIELILSKIVWHDTLSSRFLSVVAIAAILFKLTTAKYKIYKHFASPHQFKKYSNRNFKLSTTMNK